MICTVYMAVYNTQMLRPSRFKAVWNLLQKHQEQTRMWQLSVIWVLCFVCVWAGLPGEDSISQNYEACHGNTHGNTANRNNKCSRNVTRSVPEVDEHCLDRTRLQAESCDSTLRYRSVDGTCNNLNNPSWGSNGQNFLRLLEPVYDDGAQSPRQKKTNNDALPSPRDVSTGVHDFDRQRLSNRASVMLMEWGQFLAHDISATPVDSDSMTSDTCCSESLVTTGELHSDVNSGGPCFPIIISENDRHFTDVAHRCMEFVRSFPVTENNVRQQVNLHSAFVDGTNVYGLDDTAMAALRDTTGGRFLPPAAPRTPTGGSHTPSVPRAPAPAGAPPAPLCAGAPPPPVYPGAPPHAPPLPVGWRQTPPGTLAASAGKLLVENDNNLPESDTNYCVKDTDDDYCLQAGDSRVNVYPGLGALHTIFMRYHNYVAGELKTNNPTWTNDDLFHYARTIVIAVLQRITFDEYLPEVLGNATLAEYGISSDYAYDDTCDATLYNVFSTAAFRFGHSMVPDGLLIDGQVVESLDLFLRPHSVLTSLDSLVSGLASSQAEEVDRWYSEGMTDHVFEEAPFEGFDIAALNIQRGRDHGLPSYNDWRVKCGLDRVASFTELPTNDQRRYDTVYGDTDNIDLYSGALTETSVDGGIVGPTYACLLGQQFAKLRKCDRFFWETTDPVTGFDSDRQRNQIERTRLSHVICRTTGITSIQERVFEVPDTNSNPEKTCADILVNEMDLGFF